MQHSVSKPVSRCALRPAGIQEKSGFTAVALITLALGIAPIRRLSTARCGAPAQLPIENPQELAELRIVAQSRLRRDQYQYARSPFLCGRVRRHHDPFSAYCVAASGHDGGPLSDQKQVSRN